jgi:dGTPase
MGGHIDQVPTEFLETDADRIHQVVAYVGGMTDQFAFSHAAELLGVKRAKLLPEDLTGKLHP